MPPKKASKPVIDEAPATAGSEPEKEVPQFGFGKFEYMNQTTYVGNWRLVNGHKAKHGHGKITFPGAVSNAAGVEEYDGDWEDDKMHGYGRYQFTSGAVYIGQWHCGVMQGKGKMVNADGTSYDGQWNNNAMHGEGCYVDADKVTWEGIFVNGQFESKIQKKLKAEKELTDKINQYKEKALSFFGAFAETFSKSDKKTMAGNMSPYFAKPENCIDYVAEPYTKFEERPADKWNELFKQIYDEGRVQVNPLATREQSSILNKDVVLAE